MALQSIFNFSFHVSHLRRGLDRDVVDHARDTAELADRVLGATLLKIPLNFTRFVTRGGLGPTEVAGNALRRSGLSKLSRVIAVNVVTFREQQHI
jgi:hypothetical protein